MTDAPPGSSGSHRDRAGGASSDAGAWLRAWLLAGLATAALELLTSLATELPFSVGGAVLIESLFAVPGVGRLLFNAIVGRDYLVAQGAVLVIALAAVLANAGVDIAVRLADPRLRRGGGR